MLVASQSWTGAKNIVLKALESDPNNLKLTLRLADAYYGLGDYESMVPLADKIIADKNDRSLLANGYIVGIEAGLALSDRDMLNTYLDSFEKDFPEEYYPSLVRHLVAVNFGDAAAANKAADAVTTSFAGNPDVVRSLVSTWLSVGDTTSAFNYLNRNLAKEQPDDAYAALYFYRALLDVEVDQSPARLTQALSDISKAEGYFKKTYPEGHQIFDMINSMKKEWGDKLAQANAAATAPEAPAATAPAAGDAQQTAPDTQAAPAPAGQ
jgi:tetratricopeptide (TPR) repeat protein